MKNIKKIILFLTLIAAVLLFFTVFVHAFFYSPSTELTVPLAIDSTPQKPALIDSTPITIIIPALRINAVIQKVGITKKGAMAVPTNFTDTGWYKYGVVPGQQGSAIIAGHVNNGLSLPGVFAKLNQLTIGDDIYIVRKDGTTIHFIMTGSKSYAKDSATDLIFNDTSGSLLKLITCTGTWLPLQKTHDQRLVITAVLQK